MRVKFKHIKRSFNSPVIDGLAKNEDKKTEKEKSVLGKKLEIKFTRNSISLTIPARI